MYSKTLQHWAPTFRISSTTSVCTSPWTGSPLTWVIRSPSRRPASFAGPPSSTCCQQQGGQVWEGECARPLAQMGLKAHPCHFLSQQASASSEKGERNHPWHSQARNSALFPISHQSNPNPPILSPSKAARMVKLIERPALPKAKGLTQLKKFTVLRNVTQMLFISRQAFSLFQFLCHPKSSIFPCTCWNPRWPADF